MRRKLSIASIIMVVLLALQLSLVAPEELEIRSPSEFLKVEDWNNEIQQNIQGVRLVESNNGVKEWQLAAQDAIAKQENKSWVLTKAESSFYGKDSVTYDIECGISEFFSITKEVHFSESVQVKTSTSISFQSPELKYFPEKKALISDKAVSLFAFPKKGGQQYLRMLSDQIFVDLSSNQIQLSGNVYTEQVRLGKQILSLSSENAFFDQSGSKALLQKSVEVRYGEMKLSGPEAELIYDEKRKVLKKLFVRGGVQVEGQNRRANSQVLELDIASESLILTGSPRLIQKNDELLGKKIILRNAGKDLEVIGAKAHINSNSGPMVLDE